MFSGMDQGEVNQSDLAKLGNILSKELLLNNKDRSVKINTCLCIADVLRLAAPDAPFAPSDLKAKDRPSLNKIFTRLLSFLFA